MEEEGVDPRRLKLKRAFAGAEPYSEDTRKKIEAMLGIDVYNSYGLSEMNGPGVAFECQAKDGMHVWEDGFLTEIVDRHTLEPVPEGETGEMVFTILCRTATPILRYRTRDLTSFYTEPCPCGRTHRRIRRITGRTDDMLIINGVNVFPSQIEEVIMAMKEVGNNYLILVEKDGALTSSRSRSKWGRLCSPMTPVRSTPCGSGSARPCRRPSRSTPRWSCTRAVPCPYPRARPSASRTRGRRMCEKRNEKLTTDRHR
jgi:phenylacetate-CoA ligase